MGHPDRSWCGHEPGPFPEKRCRRDARRRTAGVRPATAPHLAAASAYGLEYRIDIAKVETAEPGVDRRLHMAAAKPPGPPVDCSRSGRAPVVHGLDAAIRQFHGVWLQRRGVSSARESFVRTSVLPDLAAGQNLIGSGDRGARQFQAGDVGGRPSPCALEGWPQCSSPVGRRTVNF